MTKWYEDIVKKAKSFIRKGESLSPVIFLMKKDSIDIVPLTLFADDKDVLASVLHLIVLREDPEEYVYLSEAYLKAIDTKDGGDTAIGKLLVSGTLQVSQVPSSKECIIVLYGDRKSEKLGTIVFERKKNTVKFQPIKWLEGDTLKGRFTGLRDPGFFVVQKSDK